MEEPKSKAKRGAKTAAAAQEDKITLLPLSELHDFPDHPLLSANIGRKNSIHLPFIRNRTASIQFFKRNLPLQ